MSAHTATKAFMDVSGVTHLCCAVSVQRTRAGCLKPDDVLVLPFDLMDSTEKLQAVAKAADEAFGGAGIDYLIHNAGAQSRHGMHLLPAFCICMQYMVSA